MTRTNGKIIVVTTTKTVGSAHLEELRSLEIGCLAEHCQRKHLGFSNQLVSRVLPDGVLFIWVEDFPVAPTLRTAVSNGLHSVEYNDR